jgi:hydrogenase-4 membrane subunit HyfE
VKFLIELGQGLVQGALLAIILHVVGISLTTEQFVIVIVSVTAISGVFGSVRKAIQKNKKTDTE